MITDWDDAYANRDHIPDAEGYIARWETAAAAFRDTLTRAARAELDLSYGPGPRNRFDLFRPEADPAGLVIFVHGGYWRAFDKSVWSHLAAGCLAQGWAVAMPGYTLAPEIVIVGITTEIAAAITQAAVHVPGPMRLVGHSAGGHLVSRMVCADTHLPPDILDRIEHTVSISGVHDLRPLLKTATNEDLRLDLASARAESPALLEPLPGTRLTAWVGADERPEFLRQSALIANIWTGLGADTRLEIVPGRHHFDIIDGLEDPDSPLTADVLG